MKVATLCYATDQGLGVLAKSFFDAGVVTDHVVVGHAHHVTHCDWYPGALVAPIRQLSVEPFAAKIRDTLANCDVFLSFETPFDWTLIDFCRANGVKTVIMPMHECMPERVPYYPDAWLCPSALDFKCYPDNATSVSVHMGGLSYKELMVRSFHVPVPVDVRWKLRREVRTFVHNSGHGGLRGRNGTKELLDAVQLIRHPMKLIVRSQESITHPATKDRRVDVRVGTFPHSSLWEEGDAFVFPEKFNGLSLPLQEAMAAGMLVIAGDRFPMNTWLPKEPLVPVAKYTQQRISGGYRVFDEATYNATDIAKAMDAWYARDIEAYSLRGAVWAKSMSWEKLKPVYMKVLEDVCNS